MLLLHMQIRRYFNKICDNIQYKSRITSTMYIYMDINIYYRYAPVANPLGYVLPMSVCPSVRYLVSAQ
jgi:hypothetical protein